MIREQQQTTAAGRDEEHPVGAAFARWGWAFGGVWLFFLVIPLYAAWTSLDQLWVRVLTTLCILGFAAMYIALVRHTTLLVARAEYARATRNGLIGLAVMVALMIGMCLGVGPRGLTGLPFLVTTPIYFLGWTWLLPMVIGLWGVTVALSWWAWGVSQSGFMWVIAVAVLILGLVSRRMEETRENHLAVEARLSLSEERDRMARDVHDVLGHSLTVVVMKTELARRLMDVDPERARAELDEVQDLSRQALAEVRATVGGLRVARLTDEIDAARDALEDAGIGAELPQDVSQVDPRHRIALAWVLREAVTNVLRHSRARTCRVEVGPESLAVVDDGRGMRGGREGNGLAGLRERVEQAGGTLTIGPGDDGKGTRLEVQW